MYLDCVTVRGHQRLWWPSPLNARIIAIAAVTVAAELSKLAVGLPALPTLGQWISLGAVALLVGLLAVASRDYDGCASKTPHVCA